MTKEIIKAIGKRQVLRRHTPVIANITEIFNWEIDLLSVGKSGKTYEFEVKISRQDFLRDKKKRKWELLKWNKHTPNYMSYVCPKGLISENEIPEFMGLYYFINGGIAEIKAPKQRHKELFDINEIQMKVARMYSQREFLSGVTLISHINKGIRERNAPEVSDATQSEQAGNIKSENEDELWEEVENIISEHQDDLTYNALMEELKSKIHISKK